MLNAIFRRLNGSGADPTALQAALTLLEQEKSRERAANAELHQRRHQALLDDIDEPGLMKIERAIERSEVKLEKIELAETPLREKLETARAAERRQQQTASRKRFIEEFGPIRQDLLALAARADELRAWAEPLGDASLAPCLQVLAFLSGWTVERRSSLERALAELARATGTVKAAPAQAPTAPAPRRDPPSLQHPVSRHATPVKPALLAAPRVPDDTAPLEPGEARVMVLRSGWCPSDAAPQCCSGQLIRMPLAAAQRAATAGIVELLEGNFDAAAVTGGVWEKPRAGVDPRTGNVS